MKTKLTLALLALAALAFAAAPVFTNGVLNNIQTNGVTVQAFYKNVVDVGDGKGAQSVGGLTEVSWSIADATLSVSVTLANGTTGSVSGTALFAAVQTLAAAQKTAQGK